MINNSTEILINKYYSTSIMERIFIEIENAINTPLPEDFKLMFASLFRSTKILDFSFQSAGKQSGYHLIRLQNACIGSKFGIGKMTIGSEFGWKIKKGTFSSGSPTPCHILELSPGSIQISATLGFLNFNLKQTHLEFDEHHYCAVGTTSQGQTKTRRASHKTWLNWSQQLHFKEI